MRYLIKQKFVITTLIATVLLISLSQIPTADAIITANLDTDQSVLNVSPGGTFVVKYQFSDSVPSDWSANFEIYDSDGKKLIYGDKHIKISNHNYQEWRNGELGFHNYPYITMLELSQNWQDLSGNEMTIKVNTFQTNDDNRLYWLKFSKPQGDIVFVPDKVQLLIGPKNVELFILPPSYDKKNIPFSIDTPSESSREKRHNPFVGIYSKVIRAYQNFASLDNLVRNSTDPNIANFRTTHWNLAFVQYAIDYRDFIHAYPAASTFDCAAGNSMIFTDLVARMAETHHTVDLLRNQPNLNPEMLNYIRSLQSNFDSIEQSTSCPSSANAHWQ